MKLTKPALNCEETESGKGGLVHFMECSATGGRGKERERERESERKVLPTCCQKIENYFNLHKTKNGIKLKCNATLTWGLARTMRRGRDSSTKEGRKR